MDSTAEIGGIGKSGSCNWRTSLQDVFDSAFSPARPDTLADQDTGYFCRFVFLHAASTAGRVIVGEEMREVAFFLEQPADPDEYLDENHDLHGRVPTFWATPLWLRYSEEAQLWTVSFDQLPLGHPTVKPTGGGTNMEGARCLDGIRATEKPPP